MHLNQVRGSLEVICGSMFSGKTEELLRRIRRCQFARQKVQLFKPDIDRRYSENHVQSHDANRLESTCVRTAAEILEQLDPNTRVVGIDEVQFLDEGISQVCETLAFRGIRVIVAGLDTDFRGEPFGSMPRLLSIAEYVTKLSAICSVCGDLASRSQRINHQLAESGSSLDSDQILVGAAESYEARCRFCHEPRLVHTTGSFAFDKDRLKK